MAYTTAALLKTYLGVSGSGDDTLLTALIARAQAMIDRHCHRTFEAASNTNRTFDADADVDNYLLYLDEDLASINSITNGDGDVLTTAEYTTEPRNETPYYAIRLLPSAGLSWQPSSSTGDSEGAITISGKWAWSVAAPDDIVHATIRLAAYLYHQKDTASDLDRPFMTAAGVMLPAELPRDITMILEPYRKRTY